MNQALHRKLTCCAAATLAISALAGSARATVLLQDSFADGAKTNGADTLDTNWLPTNSFQSDLAITSDSTTGPNEGAPDSAISHNPSVAFRGFVGTFPSVTLSVGQSLTLQFDALTSSGNNAEGLRFGLYNSNGTPVTTANYSGDNDDFGYFISVPTGATAATPTLHQETGTASPSDDAGSGNDVSTLSAATTSIPTPNAAYIHYIFTITHTSATGNHFSLSLLSAPYATATDVTFSAPLDSTAPYVTFDQVLFSHGNVTGVQKLDNIEVSLVPEPASAGILLMAGGLILSRRLRRRTHR
jgi:hypothetical protein